MKKYNAVTALILAGISIIVIQQSYQFPDMVNGTPGPGMWPRTLAYALLFGALTLLISAIAFSPKGEKGPIDFKSPGVWQVGKLFAVLGLFGLGLSYLGFLTSTTIFIFCVMFIMGVRSWKMLVFSSVGITASVYLIFVVFLRLVLPHGILF